VGGLQFEINDMGATPAVVSLRLSQAINILEGEAHE
ncbi:MAG: malonate decarboxylase acyl carrier protein, partial [Psychrobacter alimentarius]